MTCWYDPVVIITIGYSVGVVGVIWSGTTFSYLIYYILYVGYDVSIILYCVIGYDV